jgi:hypothetical protein
MRGWSDGRFIELYGEVAENDDEAGNYSNSVL